MTDQRISPEDAAREHRREQLDAAWGELRRALQLREWKQAELLLEQHGQPVLDHISTTLDANGVDLLTYFGCKDGHHDAFRWLLAHGASWINGRPSDHFTHSDGCVATTLAWYEAPANLKHLVDLAGEGVLDTVSVNRNTPMHAAVATASTELVLYLLEKRPQLLDSTNDFGQKPLDMLPHTLGGDQVQDLLTAWQARLAAQRTLEQELPHGPQ